MKATGNRTRTRERHSEREKNALLGRNQEQVNRGAARHFESSSKDMSEQPLFQEPFRYFRTPYSQALVSCHAVADRGVLIDQIAVRIMLDHVSSRVPPVVN